ncbi:hypothetical protein HZA76_02600 [Candidatus Roizmanbacteria bacterium]|nr:hypothetical protein [Candidatus Roizmanbacteria bacterium]
MFRKIKIFLGALFVILILILFSTKTQAAGPWDDVWLAITEIRDQIINLQSQITNIQLIPGPTGPTGPQGIQGPAGSTISYYQVFSNVRTVAPGTSGYVQAFCNSGDTVIGGGYDVSPPTGGDHMMELYTNIPFGVGAWAVAGINSGLNTNSQNLSTFAVCAHYY